LLSLGLKAKIKSIVEITKGISMRINKYLAQAGLGSRRKCEEYVLQGLVKLNGVVVESLSTQVLEGDKVEIDNQKIQENQNFKYIKFYKPKGLICSKDESHGATIFSLLPLDPTLTYIGRLDKESEGLLLISNDGRLTYKLTHPKFEKEKKYFVRVDKPITDEELRQMSRGVVIEGAKTKSCDIERLSSRSFAITLTEGRNRQIRKMCRRMGLRVHKLRRDSVGPITLQDLEVGKYSELDKNEMNYIKTILGEENKES